MDPDEELRDNRLRLLNRFVALFERFADFGEAGGLARDGATPARPTVYIVSDSLGETADQVAKAALSQFDAGHVPRRAHAEDLLGEQIEGIVHAAATDACVCSSTRFADPKLRDEMARVARGHGVNAVDIIGPRHRRRSSDASGARAAWKAGMTRKTDRDYFERIEALEFAVKHDDGRGRRGPRRGRDRADRRVAYRQDAAVDVPRRSRATRWRTSR